MNDFKLSLLYDRLDRLVESGDMTEEEARAEWRELIADVNGKDRNELNEEGEE